MGLPKTTNGYNAIWVIMDCLAKSAHLLPVKKMSTLEQLAKVYVKDIVRLNGIPKTIILDHDTRFPSHF